MAKEYITLEKKQALEAELLELKGVKRKEIASALEYAKSLGDLSENAEYSQAREDQAHLEDRIAEIEYIVKHAEIAEKHHAGRVEVGATVHLVKKGESKEKVFTIVGSEESDVALGNISNESPLGLILLGKVKGDIVSFKSPAGLAIEYTIKSVE